MQFYLTFFHKALSTSRLRTQIDKRDKLRVADWVDKCETYKRELGLEAGDFATEPSVRLASVIDNNLLLRKLFLLFKKAYSKPVLK